MNRFEKTRLAAPALFSLALGAIALYGIGVGWVDLGFPLLVRFAVPLAVVLGSAAVLALGGAALFDAAMRRATCGERDFAILTYRALAGYDRPVDAETLRREVFGEKADADDAKRWLDQSLALSIVTGYVVKASDGAYKLTKRGRDIVWAEHQIRTERVAEEHRSA